MIPLPDLFRCLCLHLEPNVQKGAALLDEKMPYWVSIINPKSLRLSDSSLCICGQLFGDYCERTIGVERPQDYGFDTPSLGEMSLFSSTDPDGNERYLSCVFSDAAWRALDQLWLDEIYWRSEVVGFRE